MRTLVGVLIALVGLVCMVGAFPASLIYGPKLLFGIAVGAVLMLIGYVVVNRT